MHTQTWEKSFCNEDNLKIEKKSVECSIKLQDPNVDFEMSCCKIVISTEIFIAILIYLCM